MYIYKMCQKDKTQISNIEKRKNKNMIFITKDEAEYLRSQSSDIKITTTSKGKNARQKKRYADESRLTHTLLNRYRGKKKGASDGRTKKKTR